MIGYIIGAAIVGLVIGVVLMFIYCNISKQTVNDAKREAEAIVSKAESRARAIVSELEIVKESQRRAAEILTAAQSQSRELSNKVAGYCENMLRNTEEQLSQSLGEVKTTRANLRQAAKK